LANTVQSNFVKFHDFVYQLGLETHQLHSDTLKVYLSNTTPDAANDTVKTDIAEITAQNGYSAGGEDITNTWSVSNGTGQLAGADITWTSTGAGFGPFRYAILYNDTAASDNLIGYWDFGKSVSCANGEEFILNVGTLVLVVA